MRQQESALRRDGHWVSGPSDLLAIAGVADRELAHSAVVAWLLAPTARHGFGSRLLEDILVAGWDPPVPDVSAAVVQREVVRESRRADIVVTAGALTLIIENKVWSVESDAQCEDLYRLWAGDGDARFLLLSPDGRPPRQTVTAAAAAAWRSMSYAGLVDWLDKHQPAGPQTLALQSIVQYLETLRSLVVHRSAFGIRVGGGHVEQSDIQSEEADGNAGR